MRIPALTHGQLVDRAVHWLKKTRRCGVVLKEHTAGSEHPDALGYYSGHSILVECKASRNDFRADQQKYTRRLMQQSLEDRPAHECWYFTAPGLLMASEIPEGWGLLEADARIVRIVKRFAPLDAMLPRRSADSYERELYRLYCEVRRYHAQGLFYRKVAELSGRTV